VDLVVVVLCGRLQRFMLREGFCCSCCSVPLTLIALLGSKGWGW
jgi:hypothetical protein